MKEWWRQAKRLRRLDLVPVLQNVESCFAHNFKKDRASVLADLAQKAKGMQNQGHIRDFQIEAVARDECVVRIYVEELANFFVFRFGLPHK